MGGIKELEIGDCLETQRERQRCPSIFMTSRWMVLSFWGGSWEARCRILSLGMGRLNLRCPRLSWDESIPAGSWRPEYYRTQELWYCDWFVLFLLQRKEIKINMSLKVLEIWTQAKVTKTTQTENQLQKHWWIWNSTRSCKHKTGKTQPIAKLLFNISVLTPRFPLNTATSSLSFLSVTLIFTLVALLHLIFHKRFFVSVCKFTVLSFLSFTVTLCSKTKISFRNCWPQDDGHGKREVDYK